VSPRAGNAVQPVDRLLYVRRLLVQQTGRRVVAGRERGLDPLTRRTVSLAERLDRGPAIPFGERPDCLDDGGFVRSRERLVERLRPNGVDERRPVLAVGVADLLPA